MNLEQIKPGSIVPFLTINNPTMLHVIPDFNTKLQNIINNLGIKMHNCDGIIVRTQMQRIGRKNINTKQYYADIKKTLMSDDDVEKKFKIHRAIPNNLNSNTSKNKFFIIDHTLISEATRYITELSTDKQGLFFLFHQLKSSFKLIKQKDVGFEHNIIFHFDSLKDSTFLDSIEYLGRLPVSQLKDNIHCFDKYIFANVNTGSKTLTFPIVYFNNGNIEVHKKNVGQIRKLLQKNERQKDTPLKGYADKNIFDTNKSSKFQSDSERLSFDILNKTNVKSATDIKNGDVVQTLDVNINQLKKILNKYSIKDPIIISNIKSSLDDYINTSQTEINEENLEKIVLMAIHKTIFNTDDIDQQYLDNPKKLFDKLKDIDTYSKKISIPSLRKNYLLTPELGLEKVTGPVRTEYEFSERIHGTVKELLKTLEDKGKNPVKVKSIKPKYDDDDLNRFISYEITLQNTSGGAQEPYKVYLKTPALLNDKYFKLNGQRAQMTNQQFFNPLTKHKQNECRLLTSYSTMTLSIENLKIPVSDIEKMIKHIELNYPKLIENVVRENDKIIKATLKKDNDLIYIDLYSNEPYIAKNEIFFRDEEDAVYKVQRWENDKEIVETSKLGKAEFIYNRLLNLIQEIDPTEELKRKPKTVSYVQMYIEGVKLPFILYLWQQMGLFNALVKLGIDYEISEKYPSDYQGSIFTFNLKGNENLYIHINSIRERLIINGLQILEKGSKTKLSQDQLNDNESIHNFIVSKNGSNAIYNMNLFTQNQIDSVTKDILKYQNKSTNVVDLISNDMTNMLFNKEPDKISDLKNYRNRQAEVMLHLMTKQINMAHSTYQNEVEMGNKDAKIFLSENHLIQALLGVHPNEKGNTLIEFTNPYSPISELKTATKTVKRGPGGLQSKRFITPGHRNIHPSYYGNFGANSTSEYEPGVTNQLTLNAFLSSKYGNYGFKNIDNPNGWEFVTLDEALIPFVNELDAQRAMMAYTHRAQVIPIDDGEVPLVSTGAEYVVPQISSSRFLIRGKRKGKVVEVKENNYVKVQYDNNEVEYLDITPRMSATKKSSYINLNLKTLEEGQTFEENDMIAWTNNFDGDAYVCGKNLKMAVMNYMGFSYEDGYAITEDTSNQFKTNTIEQVVHIIPPDTKVLKLITDKQETNLNDLLLEFTYNVDLDEYIEYYNLISNLDEETQDIVYTSQQNKMQLRSPGGKIIDIRIYINNKNSIDTSIVEAWKKLTKDVKDKIKKYQHGKTRQKDKLEATDNLDTSQLKTGNHKHKGVLFEGAKIVYFIEKGKSLNEGDKICNRYGAKGVINKIIPNDDTPYGEYTDGIQIFISPLSVLGRKNLNILKEIYIGKIFYFLPIVMSKKASRNKASTKNLRSTILGIYDNLDRTSKKKYYSNIESKLNKLSDQQLVKQLQNKDIVFNFIMEPFENIKLEDIKAAAKVIDLPLDEHVYIPEIKSWTRYPVPVGINYISAMEQLAEDSESVRSTAGYSSITGQPTKGRPKMGGQTVGHLDIFNILQFNVPSVVEELMTVKSDDFQSKNSVITNILTSGDADMPSKTGKSSTKDFYKIHMIAMGLDDSSI